MNIVTPILTAVSFVTGSVNTEAARRDNTLRETVPATSALENAGAETGLGSEADRVKVPGQSPLPLPLTYERPQSSPGQPGDAHSGLEKDNAEDPSAGKENAQSQQQEQQGQAEQKELEELQQRDLEVRTHEKAHAAIGGQYSGTPQYEYTTGPDGQRYVVGGEVSIDISAERTPEQTIRKMQQVKAAALSPAEPSPQDLRVATEATQKAMAARNDIIDEKAKSAEQAIKAFTTDQAAPLSRANTLSPVPELNDLIDTDEVGVPNRTLDQDPVTAGEAVALETDTEGFRPTLASREAKIIQRAAVIENFYQQISLATTAVISQSV
ncbi:MAG: hypothetical protein ACI965_000611 [Paraglaciecola sp.]|jgi:hypothetical protein